MSAPVELCALGKHWNQFILKSSPIPITNIHFQSQFTNMQLDVFWKVLFYIASSHMCRPATVWFQRVQYDFQHGSGVIFNVIHFNSHPNCIWTTEQSYTGWGLKSCCKPALHICEGISFSIWAIAQVFKQMLSNAKDTSVCAMPTCQFFLHDVLQFKKNFAESCRDIHTMKLGNDWRCIFIQVIHSTGNGIRRDWDSRHNHPAMFGVQGGS